MLSFLGTAPKGEQCKVGNGEDVKGPDVCPRLSSFWIASSTAVGLLRADRRLRALPSVIAPE